MEEIGELGYRKHGKNSFQFKITQGDFTRSIERHSTEALMGHARLHTLDYENGVKHDVFDDLVHQLAAVAFNAMIEAQFAQIDVDEPSPALANVLEFKAPTSEPDDLPDLSYRLMP